MTDMRSRIPKGIRLLFLTPRANIFLLDAHKSQNVVYIHTNMLARADYKLQSARDTQERSTHRIPPRVSTASRMIWPYSIFNTS